MVAIKRSSWLVLLLTLASCVTVNIYFPAAAAEKAADQIINDVWQSVEEESNKQALLDERRKSAFDAQEVSASPQAVQKHYFSPRRVALAMFDLLSSDAYAQDVNFNASSPEVERIKASMSSRFAQLRPFLDSGAVGLTSDGLVAVRDASAAAMADRGRMNQLVNAENADRKALYKAIAAANNQPSWVPKIQQTFASRWISQAKGGWWYQSGGSWVQK